MKRRLLFIAVWILTNRMVHAQASSQESFIAFFQKFSIDAAFQKSRIKFPLAYVMVEDDDSKSTKLLTANKWTFYNIRELKKDKKNTFRITYPKKDEAIIIRQLEDTGVYLEWIFNRISGKWLLVKITDSST